MAEAGRGGAGASSEGRLHQGPENHKSGSAGSGGGREGMGLMPASRCPFRRLRAARSALALRALVSFGLVLMLAVGLCSEPVAAGDDPIQAVADRQAEMDRMAKAMQVIGRFLKNEGATVAEGGVSAGTIRAVAGRLVSDLLPEGTEIGVGGSAARPELWRQWDVFGQYAANLSATAGRLAAVAATGDAGAMRAPMIAVVRACGACHELFRQKKP